MSHPSDPPRRSTRRRATLVIVACLALAIVAAPLIALLVFVELGSAALEDAQTARGAIMAEDDGGEPRVARDAGIAAIVDAARLASSDDPLPDWVTEPGGASLLDRVLVEDELAENAVAIERLERAMLNGPPDWPSGSVAGPGATEDVRWRLVRLVRLVLLRAWLERELSGAADRLAASRWVTTLFERSDDPEALVNDVSIGFARMRALELLLDHQAPTRAEVDVLRRGLGPSPPSVGTARLRRVLRAQMDAFVSAVMVEPRPPLTDDWVMAHAIRRYTTPIELTALPAERALPALRAFAARDEQDQFALRWVGEGFGQGPSPVGFEYDYERSAIVRQWHQLARAALALLEHRATHGALPEALPELGTHETWDPPTYRRVDEGFDLEMPGAWDWPIPVTAWRWRPPSEDELDGDRDDADPADEDEHPADDGVVE